VSTYAPAANLTAQVHFFVERAEDALADKASYGLAKKKLLEKSASSLAVLGLVLGMHDEDHAMKSSARGMVDASRRLAAAKDDYEAATAALADVKKAVGGTETGKIERWEQVAEMPVLMKQVPFVHNRLKSGVSSSSRLKRSADQSAGYAATIAAIAQASSPLAPERGNQERWVRYCIEMRDAAGAVGVATRQGSFENARAAMQKMDQSCNGCHREFRKDQ
jgi:hypothetical protein